MPVGESIRLALDSIRTHPLRAFFTLLGIIVSVGFLIAVVAVIQGMNYYVEDRLTGAIIGSNSFQVRRTPIAIGQLGDEEWRELQRRPIIDERDARAVAEALPDARAVALQSGWPTPTSDVHWRNQTVGDVLVFGVTAPYQIVQDYRFLAGEALTEVDIRERRYLVILGFDVAEKLFGDPELAVGRKIRVAGLTVTVKGVTEKKGSVLGQSFDGFTLMPISTFESVFGRRRTTVISVKMATAEAVEPAMSRAEEAMRVARHLRPTQDNDFTVDKADALVAFWSNLTGLLFAVIPAMVAIGIVVGGIVIMNIMLMSVNERTREIGIRKSLGARKRDIRNQFLAESVTLAVFGGMLGVLGGWAFAILIAFVTPLPARVTLWSISVAVTLGISVGLIFGVYPAARAARLDPIQALRHE